MFARPASPLRANFRHLYADTFWYGVLSGSTLSFLGVYVARLEASSLQIGLLTAGPAVINLLFSLPAGRWLEQRSFLKSTFWSAVLFRLGYLVFIPLPALFSATNQTQTIIAVTLSMAVPGVILAIAFNATLAQTVPSDYRGEVVGKRNALLAVSTTVSMLISGQILDRLAFPSNYQWVFAIGAAGAVLSTYHLWRLRPLKPFTPPGNGRPIGGLARPGMLRFFDGVRTVTGLRFLTRSAGRPLLRLDLLRGGFGAFLFAYLVFYSFQYVPIPLLPLFMVGDLHLSDGAISLGNGLFYLTMFFTSLRVTQWSASFGHRALAVTGALSYCIYPLLVGLARDSSLFWLGSLLGGVSAALLLSGMTNRLMETASAEDRPAYMALHNLVLNLGILIGSFSGPWLGEAIGLRDAILMSAGLRLVAGFVLWRLI
ncbi:MAG TPA: MFS transporter [Anaerolineales bacterium]|nr:MFS transporter [Anaerolineales bacterium]